MQDITGRYVCVACKSSRSSFDRANSSPARGRDPELLAEIRDSISKHPILRSWDLELIARHAAKSSDVLEFRRRVDLEAPTLMLKHRRRTLSRNASEKRVGQEFQVIEDLWRRSDDVFRRSLPRPVALLPDIGAAVYERVPGISLVDVLKKDANAVTGLLRLPLLSATGASIGSWLQRLHGFGGSGADRYDAKCFLSLLDHWLLKALRVGLEPGIADQVSRVAGRAAMIMDGAACPSSGIHGDFIPQNIFVHASGVAVIDFASYRNAAPIYEDLALFVAYTRLIASRWMYGQRALQALAFAFVEATYGELNPNLLELFVLKSTSMIFADQFSERNCDPKDAGKRQRIQKRLHNQSLIVADIGRT